MKRLAIAILMLALVGGARSADACTFAPGIASADDAAVDPNAEDPTLSIQANGPVTAYRNPGEGSIEADCTGLGRVEVTLLWSDGSSLDKDQAYLVEVDGIATEQLMESVGDGPVRFNVTEPLRFHFLDVGQALDFDIAITPLSSTGASGEPLVLQVVDGGTDSGGCATVPGATGVGPLALSLLAIGAVRRRARVR